MSTYEMFLHHAFWLVLWTTLPVIAAIVISSLLTGLFQALTKINDTTISLISHVIAAAVVIVPMGYWMLSRDAAFLKHTLDHLPQYIDRPW